jgi:tetratricopeptide (TPR) repeat protein
VVFEKVIDFSPEMSFDERIDALIDLEACYVSLVSRDGKILVDWQSEAKEVKPLPDPAKAAEDPEDIHSTEELYLQGLHLEQYRHATYDPAAYYLEALRREPGDVRNNNAMGLWLLRKGIFAGAEPYFRSAVATLTERNPNPYDGEPLYNLGYCLRMQGKKEEAYGWFLKAAWNGAWQDSGFFQAAQIDSIRGNKEKALELIDRSLWRNWMNQKARHLKIMLLRKAGENTAALKLIEESLELDRFNFGANYEKYLLTKDELELEQLKEQMRDNVHNYFEFSLDYAMAGFYSEALNFLDLYIDGKEVLYPMALYFKGYFYSLQGKHSRAQKAFKSAMLQAPDYCFPNKPEELLALQKAVELNPGDDKAWYYMGNFWYGARQHEDAAKCWEKSRAINDAFPTVHRNLALAYFNKQNKPQAAKVSLEKAFALDPGDARVLMELDQLYKKMNVSPTERLALLDKHPREVDFRDDLHLERATLHNLLGNEETALELLLNRKFHPWEGGEGKVTFQYLYSHIELAKKAIVQKNFHSAIDHLNSCFQYPHNLGEGKLYGAQENDVYHWLGCAYHGLGESEKAKAAWENAALGSDEPGAAMYYNDQQPDKIFYQGLALQKLGKTAEANARFSKLLKYGEKQLSIPFKMDYFAVSLPDLLIFEDDLQKRHEQHCHYLMALGHLGIENKEKAQAEFDKVLADNRYHIGALIHQKLLVHY